MTLKAALDAGDADLLPGRRDEGWRWTDLRGLLRALPPPAGPGAASARPELLAGFAAPERRFVNGRRDLAGDPEAGRLLRRFLAVEPDRSARTEDDLIVADGASLLLVDLFETSAAGALSSVCGRLSLGAGARVERLVLARDDADAVSVGDFEVELAPGSVFSQTTLTQGARRQRLETRVQAGRGVQVRLDGLYVLDGRRHSDQTTDLRHNAGEGVSRQLVKGLAAGQARSVFQGRIVVARGADGTDARMGAHALLTSDRAEADAKPELEIYADDVQCAHGATVGALDAEALFYVRSRGLAEAEARALLARGFLAEVVERVEHPDLRDIAAAWLEAAVAEAAP